MRLAAAVHLVLAIVTATESVAGEKLFEAQKNKVYGEPTAAEALVYVVRPSRWARYDSYFSFVDTTPIGASRAKTYSFALVSEGKHVFWGKKPPGTLAFNPEYCNAVYLEVEPDRTYYLEQGSQGALQVLTPAEGKKALAKCRYTQLTDAGLKLAMAAANQESFAWLDVLRNLGEQCSRWTYGGLHLGMQFNELSDLFDVDDRAFHRIPPGSYAVILYPRAPHSGSMRLGWAQVPFPKGPLIEFSLPANISSMDVKELMASRPDLTTRKEALSALWEQLLRRLNEEWGEPTKREAQGTEWQNYPRQVWASAECSVQAEAVWGRNRPSVSIRLTVAPDVEIILLNDPEVELEANR